MIEVTLQIDEQDLRAVEAHIGKGKVSEWLQHALDDKTRRCVDRIIEEQTDRQPKKLQKEEKLALIKKIPQEKLDAFYDKRHPKTEKPEYVGFNFKEN